MFYKSFTFLINFTKMLKKIFILILIFTNSIPTIVAQNFGISLQNTIWKGSILTDSSSDKKTIPLS